MKLSASGQTRVLPVLYGITFQELPYHSGLLAETDSIGMSANLNSGDAEMLRKLHHPSMIVSNTSDVVRDGETACIIDLQPVEQTKLFN